MRGIDQRLQLVGRAVGTVGCKRQHAVVAPVALCPGKSFIGISSIAVMPISAKPIELAPVHPRSRQTPGVQFVQNSFVPRPAAPILGVAPAYSARGSITTLGPCTSSRLRARRRDRARLGPARGDSDSDAPAPACGLGFEPAPVAQAGWVRRQMRPSISTAILLLAGSPEPECAPIWAEQAGAERQVMCAAGHGAGRSARCLVNTALRAPPR